MITNKYAWETSSNESDIIEKVKDITLFDCKCGGKPKFIRDSDVTLSLSILCEDCGLKSGSNKQHHKTASQWNMFQKKLRTIKSDPSISFSVPVSFSNMDLNKGISLLKCACSGEPELVVHHFNEDIVSIKCKSCQIETGKGKLGKVIKEWER